MVVFTCNHCGDSLQKPRVEKHYDTTCKRNPKSLTCVDCLKDFRLEEYAAHTKCITETERYAAKGTVIGTPKGEKKQETWVETVQKIIEEQKSTVGPNIKKVFDMMLNHPNIPKKKKPFINYLTSSSGRKLNVQDIEEVWNILETSTKKNTNTTNGTNKNENGAQNEGKKKKNKKSKQATENGLNETNDESTENKVTTDNPKKSKKRSKSKQVDTSEEPDVPKKKLKVEETSEDNEKSKKVEPESLAKEKTEETETPEESPKKKRRKSKTTTENIEKQDKFRWKEIIFEILQKFPDGVHDRKLEHKVIKKYEKIKGIAENKSNVISKYKKKLKALASRKEISLEKDQVKLVA